MTGSQSTPLDGWIAVILAAGRGTRMRSSMPKVLHPVCGRPMVRLVLDTVREAGFRDIVVVTSAGDDAVARALGDSARVAVQPEPLGTGHAALAARSAAGEAPQVMILNGFVPLLSVRTLRELAQHHEQSGAVFNFLTAHLDDPTGYGRVIRRDGRVTGVVEESETDSVTRDAAEVNAGLYAASAGWLWPALDGLEPGPRGERYLTSLVSLAAERDDGVQTQQVTESTEVQQVNTRGELARVETIMRERVREALMDGGVTLIDPATTYVDVGVRVGEDTTLLPGVHLLGDTTVGGGCRIGPNAVLRDMQVGDDCEIDGSTLEGSTLASAVSVGPYSHVRPGSRIDSGAHLGNYVEVKASAIGPRTKVGHFAYLGDAEVGADVNIGAGTVTCNYDGTAKHCTRIGDGAFIGSDSMLIAPVEVGAGARTAAGSVVTEDVAPHTLVMGVPARVRSASAPAGEEEA